MAQVGRNGAVINRGMGQGRQTDARAKDSLPLLRFSGVRWRQPGTVTGDARRE